MIHTLGPAAVSDWVAERTALEEERRLLEQSRATIETLSALSAC